MIFGRLFKVIALLALLASSLLLFGCEGLESRGMKYMDNNFPYLVTLHEFTVNTEGLNYVSRDWKLNEGNFGDIPTGVQKHRFGVIKALLGRYKIKSISVERNSMSTEFNVFDSGVFGDSYLSLVYSEFPARSTILTTPETWRCLRYSVDRWYVCSGLNDI